MTEKLTGDFRKYMDKSFLGAWDLADKGDTVLTIDHVERNEVKNERGSEKKMVVHFMERDYKPMICNVTNAKAISKAVGSTKVEAWEKKKIALYKATINAFGDTTECIRVRDYAPKTDELICEVCGEVITDHEADGKTYKAKVIANKTLSKYGKYMCFDCASAAKAEQEAVDGM